MQHDSAANDYRPDLLLRNPMVNRASRYAAAGGRLAHGHQGHDTGSVHGWTTVAHLCLGRQHGPATFHLRTARGGIACPVDMCCTTVPTMTNHYGSNGGTSRDSGPRSRDTLLAIEFAKRIETLGISRRQLTERTGLSRQTLHNIEHSGRVDLKPSTLNALDKGLLWRPGTALALSRGDDSVLESGDQLASNERQAAYRWQIVERISRMTLSELERMVSIMEAEALGESVPMETQDVISQVEERVARIEARLQGGVAQHGFAG